MNSNFMLQNYIENGSQSTTDTQQRGRRSTKGGTTYNEVCQLFEDHNMDIEVPQQVTKVTDKLTLLKQFIEYFIKTGAQATAKVNESGAISCTDCQNYESSLQKLQNQVRQHIRLEQQLKIFQDSMEQKIDEYKKDKKQTQKKIDNQKKQLEDMKIFSNGIAQKNKKLQNDNENLKAQIKQLKRNVSISQPESLPSKREHREKPLSYNYESKENKIDWVHRNISIKKDEKEKEKACERKSIEKRNDSAQKWRMSNHKSNKMISMMNDKMIQEKSKEERRKAVQPKFQYRR